jgi:SagB-type dehydrogenase family enzyme
MFYVSKSHVRLVFILILHFATGGVMAQELQNFSLPNPKVSGDDSLEQLLKQRRSVREFRDEAVNLQQLGQLLWAAQGITHGDGMRTAPSAGALYPLELYVAVGKMDGLVTGLYHYYPGKHRLINTSSGDLRKTLARSALQQPWVQQAPMVIIIAAKYARTTRKYGDRGIRYVHIEVGSVAQNIYLQAQALALGTVIVGAFDDAAVADALHLPSEIQPLLLMPVGIPH